MLPRGFARIQLARLFCPQKTHSVKGAHVAFAISLMTTRILVFGWSAHLNMETRIGVGYLAILSALSNAKKQVLLILGSLCSLMGVTAVLHAERFLG